MTRNTTTSLTINSFMTSCIDELNSRCTGAASSIATDDDKLIQNIGNLVNQQIAAIEESNRHLDEIDDIVHLLKNLRGGITQMVKRHAKVALTTQSKQSHPKAFTTWTPTTCMEEPCIE